MKPRPVRRVIRPAYPTRLQTLADPRLLETKTRLGLQPAGGAAAGVMTFIAANLAGCSEVTREVGTLEAEVLGRAVVAPLFEHGLGRGVTGCVMVCPPSFLSEEEALQVIVEEFSRVGVEPEQRNVELEGVQMPERPVDPVIRERLEVREPRNHIDEWHRERLEKEPRQLPIHADLHDPGHKIFVEFISREDHNKLGRDDLSGSTVYSFDFADVARRLRDEVSADGEGIYFGAFYDPAVGRSFDGTVRDPDSRELLRRQVRDFVQWLEAQGAIQ